MKNKKAVTKGKFYAKKKKPMSKGKRIFLIVLGTIVTLMLVAGIAAGIWINQTMNLINRDTNSATLSDEEIESILSETEPGEEDAEGVEINEDDVNLNIDGVEVLDLGDNTYNILLIGQDRRANMGRHRSDAMILCTLDLDEKTLVMTSFLRDTYVAIPSWNGKNYAKNRLNVNYVIGGMEMLDQCIKDNFGVEIDYNVEVDFFGFTKIVDLMGGVDIELTKNEAGHINGIHGTRFKGGVNHLNGEQALTYSRIRKLDNDFGRTNRQRNVLKAMMENVKKLSLSDAKDMITEILPMITTDMSNTQILDLALKILPVLPELQVSTQYIPADGTYYFARIHEMSVIVADMDANRQILKDTIGKKENIDLENSVG